MLTKAAEGEFYDLAGDKTSLAFCQADAQRGSSQREQQRFRKQLPGKSAAGCSEA